MRTTSSWMTVPLSFWYYQFVEGDCLQMGQDWRPNKALILDLLLLVLESTELKIWEAVSLLDENRGHTKGPAISDLAGNVLTHQAMNDSLLEVLKELFDVSSLNSRQGNHTSACSSLPHLAANFQHKSSWAKGVSIRHWRCEPLEGSWANGWQQTTSTHEGILCRTGVVAWSVPTLLHPGHVTPDYCRRYPIDSRSTAKRVLEQGLGLFIVACLPWVSLFLFM